MPTLPTERRRGHFVASFQIVSIYGLVKLVKVQGEFIWHRHGQEDELFLVTKSRLNNLLKDREVSLEEAEICIVPAGVERKPPPRFVT